MLHAVLAMALKLADNTNVPKVPILNRTTLHLSSHMRTLSICLPLVSICNVYLDYRIPKLMYIKQCTGYSYNHCIYNITLKRFRPVSTFITPIFCHDLFSSSCLMRVHAICMWKICKILFLP